MYTINSNYNLPDKNGYFGEFGGMLVSEKHKKVLLELEKEFNKYFFDENFRKEVYNLLQTFSGRPTPLYFASKFASMVATKALTSAVFCSS